MRVPEIVKPDVGANACALHGRQPDPFAEVRAGQGSAAGQPLEGNIRSSAAKVEVLDVPGDRLDELDGDPEAAGLVVLRIGLGDEALAGRAVSSGDFDDHIVDQERASEEVEMSDPAVQITFAGSCTTFRPAPPGQRLAQRTAEPRHTHGLHQHHATRPAKPAATRPCRHPPAGTGRYAAASEGCSLTSEMLTFDKPHPRRSGVPFSRSTHPQNPTP